MRAVQTSMMSICLARSSIFFFPEREWLLGLQNQKSLEDFRHFEQTSVLHFLGILFEAVLPIAVGNALSAREETKDFGHFAGLGHFT